MAKITWEDKRNFIDDESIPREEKITASDLNEIKRVVNNNFDEGGGGGIGGDTPIGVIHEYAGESAPAGYLLCNGQEVSRSDYANLFAVIGNRYGDGDGNTTFNLPNICGRVPVGLDVNDPEFDMLGKRGGSKTHTLTTAEMPSHTHVQNAHKHSASGSSAEAGSHGHSASSNSTGAHTHTTSGTAASAGSHKHTGLYYRDGMPISFTVYDGDTTGYMTDYKNQSSVNASYITTGSGGAHTHSISGTAASAGGHSHTITVTSNGAHTHTVSVTVNNATAVNQLTGGGLAHNNMQPYIVLNYIIKY